MDSPDELRRRAAEYEGWAIKLERRAKLFRKHAATERRMADEIEAGAQEGLSSISEDRSMLSSKMELQNERVNKRVKISSKMTSDSPAKKALLEANITPRDVAALLGVGHSTVNAWCTGARSIPRAYVDRLKEKHRISVKVWPKIAG